MSSICWTVSLNIEKIWYLFPKVINRPNINITDRWCYILARSFFSSLAIESNAICTVQCMSAPGISLLLLDKIEMLFIRIPILLGLSSTSDDLKRLFIWWNTNKVLVKSSYLGSYIADWASTILKLTSIKCPSICQKVYDVITKSTSLLWYTKHKYGKANFLQATSSSSMSSS